MNQEQQLKRRFNTDHLRLVFVVFWIAAITSAYTIIEPPTEMSLNSMPFLYTILSTITFATLTAGITQLATNRRYGAIVFNFTLFLYPVAYIAL
jgi:hypothetical protein